MPTYNVENLRRDFPILERQVYGKPLIYLDNTATSQTPREVVEAIEQMYFAHKANVHRGVFSLSQESTAMQEAAREKVRAHINAASASEIIFTRGTTEAINLVASSFGSFFENGDEIILTVMEHHANIVPWQLLGTRKRITIRVVPITPRRLARPRRLPHPLQRAHTPGSVHSCVECARHGQPRQGDDRLRHTASVCPYWSTARRPSHT